MSAIDACLEHNARYAADFCAGGLDARPARRLVVVTCKDARIETGAMLGLAEGDAHVIRNGGGVVTDDVIRSLTISQRMLGTREIMLIQHTGCGMLMFDGEEFRDQLAKETGVRPGFGMETFDDLEANLRASVERVRECPFLLHTDAVRGFVYDVETGRLRELA